MPQLTIEDFPAFFRELHGFDPYPWQQQLAERAVQGDWPGAIDLPTGSGKTACIDIAIFALATQASLPVSERTAPRRIFFCVNRRVIVDEAYQRSIKIAKAIWNAELDNGCETPTIAAVARCLRSIAGPASSMNEVPPLDTLELRGGIYRDNRWARTASQPTVICSTIDQIGSRLLFRGYGVSDNAAPIQAALIAYDSLILLDEAHISEPFRQTVESVRQYLDPERWARHPLDAEPLVFVPMTATPTDEMAKRGVIALTGKDRECERLTNRLQAGKPARLEPVADVVRAAVAEAKKIVKDDPKAVGIIVNRVASARAIYAELLKLSTKQPSMAIELVIGSMRPVDRDDQQQRLQDLIGPDRPTVSEQMSFTISTQCLEVGADYDFDVLITECASLDALRQRFGRLNRAGRKIQADGVILAGKGDIKGDDKLDDSKALDPIYGNALARTWNWLNEHATDGSIDFGIDCLNRLIASKCKNGRPPTELLAPSAMLDAPVMLPAYLDLWCQTSPRPAVEPEPSLFIHGPQDAMRDVQICWRGDLVNEDPSARDTWIDVVSLLPPTAAECMSVPISRLRRWLVESAETEDAEADLLGCEVPKVLSKDRKKPPVKKILYHCILWRGLEKSKLVDSPKTLSSIRPGDTIVIPTAAGGWNELGHIPAGSELSTPAHEADRYADPANASPRASEIDVAERAWRDAKDRGALRICAATRDRFPRCDGTDSLFSAALATEEPLTVPQWRQAVRYAGDSLAEVSRELSQQLRTLASKKHGLIIERYPSDNGVVLTTRRRINSGIWVLSPLDEGEDETSHTNRRHPVTLRDHTKHVVDAVADACEHLLADRFHRPFQLAAEFHDLGKADERFQALLRRTSVTDAWLMWESATSLLAKSDGQPLSRKESNLARNRAGLPKGFRHEMLSMQLAERSGRLPEDRFQCNLILHLNGSHHGRGRPLPRFVDDPNPPAVEVEGIVLSMSDRQRCHPHRLDSGIAERFWELTRAFGWWGLAYLESVFRLADQQASAMEESTTFDSNQKTATSEPVS